jgi:hypothetical protein
MSQNWLRAGSLTVGGGSGISIDFSQPTSLRVRFVVSQAKVQSPAAAEIRVYNLSTSTAQSLVQNAEGQSLTLSAGYQGNVGTIFQGDIKKAQAGRENPTDTFVDFYCAGGDKAYNWGVINKTFASGSTQQDHVNEVLRVMSPFGITQGTVKGLSTTPYPRAVSLFGMARDVMRTIAHSNNASWYINNNQLNHIPNNGQGSGSTITLNANTGLVGMPVQTQGGIIVTALINPSFAINGQLTIDQKDIQLAPWGLNYDDLNNQTLQGVGDGTYTIFAIEWRGDLRGTEWYASMSCYGSTTGKLPNSGINYTG